MGEFFDFLNRNPWLVLLIKVVVSVIIYILLRLIFKGMFKRMRKRSNGVHIKYFNSLIKIVLIILEVYYLLTLFDATRSISKTLLGGGAVLLTVISFGAQQAMGNIISGLFISASKPYELEDKIKVVSGGSILAEGIVKDITTRHSVIQTFDGQTCIIPNSIMDSSVIVNTTYNDTVGNFLTVEIAYDSNVDKAIEILKRLIIEHDLTLNDNSTIVALSQMTDNGLLLKTTVWTKNLSDNFSACSDIRRRILAEFKDAGIVIPYNTVTIKGIDVPGVAPKKNK